MSADSSDSQRNGEGVLSRLAVCSWSLQPKNADDLLEMLGRIQIKRVQIALDPFRENPDGWASYARQCQDTGFQNVSGMMVTVGEDYSTMEAIKRTGGVVPDETWDENWKNFQDNVRIASDLGLDLVTFHAGFLPHDEGDPDFQKLLDRIQKIADLFNGEGMSLGFETGQETAETLRAFLQKLNRPNVGVNFDPANMILYDKGDPIEALRTLGPWLKQCHIKDATATTEPGTWGEEVTTGTGQVNWSAFLKTVDDVGFQGDFAIEREAGDSRVEDIIAARNHVKSLTH